MTKLQQAWELFKVALRAARRREELRPKEDPQASAGVSDEEWSNMLCTRCGVRMGDHRVDVAVPPSARSHEDVQFTVCCPKGALEDVC